MSDGSVKVVRKSVADATLIKAIEIALLILPCVWGADYLMTPPRSTMFFVEKLVPIVPLGGVLLFLGVAGLIGEWWRETARQPASAAAWSHVCQPENRWWLVYASHVAFCAIYMGLGAGCTVEQLVNTHFYGIRVTVTMYVLALAHLKFAQRCRRVSRGY